MKRAIAVPAAVTLLAAPLAMMQAPGAAAKPKLRVSETTGLKAGDKITVSAAGFAKDSGQALWACANRLRPGSEIVNCRRRAPTWDRSAVVSGPSRADPQCRSRSRAR
ncbi:neocarzinostatin apoprotein domain-containing protein [Actinomadura yumaensis]|uniref:neocarzinostatin apoprotein domain-containing protein n=1 Tax=Actinomadura yumaensis TaxID=111807 RepID=UPI0036077A36